MTNRKPTLDIIIVNWNSGRQLGECLNSILEAEKKSFELSRIRIVDNSSSDNSLSNITHIKLPLSIIRNSENKGFAYACNQGAKSSSADYLLFLNPDVKLFKYSLEIPLSFMDKPENKGIAICGIQLVDDKGRVQKTCSRFPNPVLFLNKITGLNKMFPGIFKSYQMLEWNHKTTKVVEHVIGAFFLVRRNIFESMKGFDENFFVYFEDVDFSYRVYKSGFKSIYLATIQAYHRGCGTSSQIKDKRLFYSLRSKIIYSYKHFSFFSASIIFIVILTIGFISRFISGVIHKSVSEINNTLKAYGLLISDFPEIFKKIIKVRRSKK